jgi:hypothetical protein
MKTASLHEIKKELSRLPDAQLAELLMRLAKHKKENKELLGYLLFDASDQSTFTRDVKDLIDENFSDINRSNVYLAKKGLRKILRFVNKYIKFSGSVEISLELLGYFLMKLKKSGIPIVNNTVIGNMYEQQVKKIRIALSKLHEDLQYDYSVKLEGLI